MVTTKSFRSRKRKHLRPLIEASFAQAYLAMEQMPSTSLRALLRIMDELTTTNCWWAEYRFAELYRPMVQRLLELKRRKSREA